MTATMAQPPASLAPALERLRRGDIAGARAAAEAALAGAPDSGPLLSFAGLVAAEAGDPAAAAAHFRRALALAPGDPGARINLATALVAAGAFDEAAEICAGHGDPRLQRLAAYAHQQQRRFADAAAAYRAALAADPADFESWNNLGNTLAAAGDKDGAAAALREAVALRPDVAELALNLSRLLPDERAAERAAMLRGAAAANPANADLRIELGLAQAAAGDFAAAEAAYRAAIELRPDLAAAYVELALLLETQNRIDDLETLVGAAEARGLAGGEIGFLRAWALRRQGRFAEALPLAEAAPASIDPVRRAQLRGEIHDRLGDPARAFAAFAEMNRAAAAAEPRAAAPPYRETLAERAALLTPEQVAAWTSIAAAAEPPAPVFILGFPRSGTTLLDTLLMNLPDLDVLEEMPVVDAVERRLGGIERLAALDAAEANALRSHYFEALAALSPPAPGQIVVDKFPLHMARAALIHRLFPDAKFVFVERHPCDAVLSCFMANFKLSRAMLSFTDIEEAARTYDALFDLWTRAEALLPLNVHRIRYERMIEDLEGEMRALLAFIGIPWDEKVLDNRASAARRGYVRTASYAQVAEPIYRRAAGRWERYRDQLTPILPILAPWAEKMGYGM